MRDIGMFDTSVPALLITIGRHEWDYGALATVRTLGRVGIPVFATVSRADTPITRSRFLTRAMLWPTTGQEPDDQLVDALLAIVAEIGIPPVVIAGDDESAVLLARRAPDLRGKVLQVPVDPALPGRLASKAGLAELCAATGTPTPRSAAPRSWDEVRSFVEEVGFPLIVKNPEPFARLVDPAVSRTERVVDDSGLSRALARWSPGMALLISEFLPPETSQDWYVAAALGPGSEPLVAFSGRKLRAYPADTGVGTLSESMVNERLIDEALAFCRAIGYAGLVDMDWRYDQRHDQYKLLDFNPRRGAQFSLFATDAGIDVLRALHLHLTGRPIPAGVQVERHRHVVGISDQRAFSAQVRLGRSLHRPVQIRRGRVARSWWARDDPRPALAFAAQLGPLAKLLGAARRPGA